LSSPSNDLQIGGFSRCASGPCENIPRSNFGLCIIIIIIIISLRHGD